MYIGYDKAPAITDTRAFVLGNIEKQNPHFVAIADGQVVGWCDICRLEKPFYRHVGILGLGLIPTHRGGGLGTKLLTTTIDAAWLRGFVRVELTVHSENTRAIALYEKVGFCREGELVDATLIDGVYQNSVVMGLVRRPGRQR